MYGFVLSSLRRVKRDGGLAERGVVPSGCIWLVLSTSTSITRGQAAEHFVVVFIHRVAVCDLFLEAFVKSFVLLLGRRYRRVSSQGISAELRRTGVSVIVSDMGLNSFDWSENNSNLSTGDRPFRFLKVCHGP